MAARFPKKFSSKLDLNLYKIYDIIKTREFNSFIYRIKDYIKFLNDDDALKELKQMLSGLKSLEEHVIDQYVGAGANGIVFSLQDLPDYYLKLTLSDRTQDMIMKLGQTKTTHSEYSKLNNIPNVNANVLSSENNGTFVVIVIEKAKSDIKTVIFDTIFEASGDYVRTSKGENEFLNLLFAAGSTLTRTQNCEEWFSLFLDNIKFQEIMNELINRFNIKNPLEELEKFYEEMKADPKKFQSFGLQYLELCKHGRDVHYLNFGTRENNPDKFVGFDI